MSPSQPGSSPSFLRFPRVSGDEPGIVQAIPQLIAFSPRERG